jgi:hypothetical protein
MVICVTSHEKNKDLDEFEALKVQKVELEFKCEEEQDEDDKFVLTGEVDPCETLTCFEI